MTTIFISAIFISTIFDRLKDATVLITAMRVEERQFTGCFYNYRFVATIFTCAIFIATIFGRLKDATVLITAIQTY